MRKLINQVLNILGLLKSKVIIEKEFKKELMKLSWRYRENSDRDRLIENGLIDMAYQYGYVGVRRKRLIIWISNRREVLCVKIQKLSLLDSLYCQQQDTNLFLHRSSD